jgi:ubiquinone biosynthesis monooxygenase Coq7
MQVNIRKTKMRKPEFRKNSEIIHEIIRVNHAGEYGAVHIYNGQLKKIKENDIRSLMEHMLDSEKIHLSYFENQIKTRQVRPTIMLPIWNFLGRSLGKITGFYSNNLAMLVTESVETTINEHYLEQIEYLNKIQNEKELLSIIEKFRQEELEHHDIAVENGSRDYINYQFFNNLIKMGCRFAISISKII